MARAYASAIIKAPIETVWGIIRNFNGLPDWAVNIADSKIEGGLDADVVGCIRSFHTASPIISKSQPFRSRTTSPLFA
jgi:Polyketide cyclase / dehydrase and lipid transport